MFQFLFTILDKLGSVLLYVIDSGILCLLFFSLLLNSSFLSILSISLICPSGTYSLYCRSRILCLMVAQFLSNSVIVEQIILSLSPIQEGEEGEQKGPPTSFSPVTSTIIEISSQNFLVFSFNPFATLV